MTATTEQHRIIKAEADRLKVKYRLTKDDVVHFFGPVPNLDQDLWYFFAWTPEEAVEIISRNACRILRTTNDGGEVHPETCQA